MAAFLMARLWTQQTREIVELEIINGERAIMAQDDRRKHHRRSRQNIISFHIIEDTGEEKSQQATVIDSSGGGLRLRTQKSLGKNTRIYITLDSEEWGEELTVHCRDEALGLVEMIGSVMWCLESRDNPGEYDVGTRFLGLVEQ